MPMCSATVRRGLVVQLGSQLLQLPLGLLELLLVGPNAIDMLLYLQRCQLEL